MNGKIHATIIGITTVNVVIRGNNLIDFKVIDLITIAITNIAHKSKTKLIATGKIKLINGTQGTIITPGIISKTLIIRTPKESGLIEIDQTNNKCSQL